jgi:hypothetical protein
MQTAMQTAKPAANTNFCAHGASLIHRWLAVSVCAALVGCANITPGDGDECAISGWHDRADAASIQAFSVRVLKWDTARFTSACTATADAAALSPGQRLRLAVAYAAPNNPRRSFEQTNKLLGGLGEGLGTEAQAAAALISHMAVGQQTVEQQIAALQAERTIARNLLTVETERADTEARRANEAQRRSALAEERLRESERRFADANLRLNEANRRLDAVKQVDDTLSRRNALRRINATNVPAASTATATPPTPASSTPAAAAPKPSDAAGGASR